MTYKGGCHCGRIGFEVEGDIEQVVECNCSICSKRGYLLWFVPQEQLRLATPQADLATLFAPSSGQPWRRRCKQPSRASAAPPAPTSTVSRHCTTGSWRKAVLSR